MKIDVLITKNHRWQDTIYNVTDAELKKFHFDTDPSRRLAQIINHELYHACRPALVSFLSSRNFLKMAIIAGASFFVLSIISKIESWNVTIIFAMIASLSLLLSILSTWLDFKEEISAFRVEESTVMDSRYGGIRKDLFDRASSNR